MLCMLASLSFMCEDGLDHNPTLDSSLTVPLGLSPIARSGVLCK